MLLLYPDSQSQITFFYTKSSCSAPPFSREVHSLFTSVVDLDPHRDGENGSGTDPGTIKGSQNKG